jgi:hypothetical protein
MQNSTSLAGIQDSSCHLSAASCVDFNTSNVISSTFFDIKALQHYGTGLGSPAIVKIPLSSSLWFPVNLRNRAFRWKTPSHQISYPEFSAAAYHTWDLDPPHTLERRFWIRFITPCLLIGESGWRFSKLDDTNGSLVDQLFKGFKISIVKVDDFAEALFLLS